VQAEQGARSARGVVQAGKTEIHYTCTGAGPPVLLFAGTPEPALRVALAARFRVIEPHLPYAPTRISIVEWLCALVDGLGLDCPSAVIVAESTDEVAAFARADVDCFGKVETIRGAACAKEIAVLLASLDGSASRPPPV